MAAVFVCAFAVRMGLGTIFFGSVDMTNSVLQSHSLSARVPVYLPYLPFVETLLFLVAQVHDHTTLPLSMPIKVLPSLADSLLASAVVAVTPERRPTWAWLYATCPLSLILVSLHGQWDPLWLLPTVVALAIADGVRRVPTIATSAIIGTCLAVAAICKPIPLALAPAALVARDRWSSARGAVSVGVSAGTMTILVALMLVVYNRLGFDLGRVLEGVLGYGASGRTVVVFGLPRLLGPLGVSVGSLRLASVALASMILLRRLIWPSRQCRMATAAALCFVLPAVGGLAPQYLLWALPFLIAGNRFTLATVYAGATSLFLIAYYVMPRSPFIEGENLGTFLPLRTLPWLAPPLALTEWFDSDWVLKTYRAVADAGVPLGMLVLAILVLRHPPERHPRVSAKPGNPALSRSFLVLPFALSIVGGAVAYGSWPADGAGERNRARLAEDAGRYLARPPGLGSADEVTYRPLADADGPIVFSAPFLMALATVAWTASAAYTSRSSRCDTNSGFGSRPC